MAGIGEKWWNEEGDWRVAFSSQQLQPDELSVVLSVLVGLPLEELMDKLSK